MSKKVIVTGGAGFIGSHVIEYILTNTDWTVTSLDRLDFSGSLRRLDEIMVNPHWKNRLKLVWHDLKAAINPLTTQDLNNCNYVLHLAAGSHVDRSIDFPLDFVMDNVVGTCNLLDWARTLPNLEKFLYFSTDEVFGPAPQGVYYSEWDRYNSGNPYSASKAGAEELCLAYANTYRMPIFITHTMNVFGIRQHPEKFIPLVMRKVLKDETVFIHANAECTEAGKRHYISTEDVANAVVFLIDKGIPKDKYNIVGEREVDNLQLAQMIANIIGKPLNYKLVDFHSSRPGHDLRYALNGKKMQDLGWVPQKKVEERLNEVVKWSLKNTYWIGL